jgi:predicted metal-dependent hydrolase
MDTQRQPLAVSPSLSETPAGSGKRAIKPRSPELPIDAAVKRHWLADNIVGTALGNSVNLLFPAGERFFVRSVRHYLPQISSELRERVQGFFGQEGRHAQAHERVNTLLTEQGFKVDGFLRAYEKLCYGITERLAPPALRLAATAACEHFTAIMADNFMRQSEFLERLDPTMRRLLLWHAAEEIEHKAVAFDVLKAVNPSYPLRLLGLGFATFFLGVFWLSGTLVLLNQERQQLGLSRIRNDMKRIGRMRKETQRSGIVAEVFLRGIREYMRRDFHPNDNDNYALAEAYLSAAGLA